MQAHKWCGGGGGERATCARAVIMGCSVLVGLSSHVIFHEVFFPSSSFIVIIFLYACDSSDFLLSFCCAAAAAASDFANGHRISKLCAQRSLFPVEVVAIALLGQRSQLSAYKCFCSVCCPRMRACVGGCAAKMNTK